MLNNPKVKHVKISRHHFDIITPKDINTIYFIEETSGEITLNLGDAKITSGRFSNEELLELFDGKQDKNVFYKTEENKITVVLDNEGYLSLKYEEV